MLKFFIFSINVILTQYLINSRIFLNIQEKAYALFNYLDKLGINYESFSSISTTIIAKIENRECNANVNV